MEIPHSQHNSIAAEIQFRRMLQPSQSSGIFKNDEVCEIFLPASQTAETKEFSLQLFRCAPVTGCLLCQKIV